MRKMARCKAPGSDGVQGFWFIKLIKPHGRITVTHLKTLEKCTAPEWQTYLQSTTELLHTYH